MGMKYQTQKANEDKFREKLKIKKSKSCKYVGIRQRASGKWAAEIKDTSRKIRMWLGTYQTAEEAARAYDEAACLLRGSNTRTNFSNHHGVIATNSPTSLKLKNILNQKAFSNQIQIQTENQSTMTSHTIQGGTSTISPNCSAVNSIMVFEESFQCNREGNSQFWVQNEVSHSDNPYRLDMNMINCSVGVAPNNTPQFDYTWPLSAQQRVNELSMLYPKDGLEVERQLSTSLYAMNEYNVEDAYPYEYDVNFALPHLLCLI